MEFPKLTPADAHLARDLAGKLGFAVYRAKTGDLFGAGLELGAARSLTWKIQDGETHERAQALCTAILHAIRKIHYPE